MHEIWEAVSAIASVLTALAVIFAIMQLVTARKQRHREFELVYVQRYWSIVDRLSFDIGVEIPVAGLNETDAKLCLQYLRLCEDELDLRKRRFVTDETWEIWKQGIRFQVARKPFAELMKSDVVKTLDLLPPFHIDPAKSDPLALSNFLKRWYGLL
ncbi:hypothetical protein [Arthrobacter cryoconiti]|uniref:Uncharacterized protein n=1 Tax=Arthrobacter cryoconiti TaxID=748907 RepID=A0ABV8QZK2_9MICC|nr:hypothetical protein [Arthrobacter cryoconiti]MCC9068628.1 hypothetical protein [Arthrobacter cryoconiti]